MIRHCSRLTCVCFDTERNRRSSTKSAKCCSTEACPSGFTGSAGRTASGTQFEPDEMMRQGSTECIYCECISARKIEQMYQQFWRIWPQQVMHQWPLCHSTHQAAFKCKRRLVCRTTKILELYCEACPVYPSKDCGVVQRARCSANHAANLVQWCWNANFPTS